MIVALVLVYIFVLYILIFDWAYLAPDHKVAFTIEVFGFIGVLSVITYLLQIYPSFYSNGGRKIDMLILAWLGRELIHTRVRFYKARREMTNLVAATAEEQVVHYW